MNRDLVAFPIFATWYVGKPDEARACWDAMAPDMRAPWYRSADAAIGVTTAR